MGGAYLAGEQTAFDGFPLHGGRTCGGSGSCQVPLGFQQPLLEPNELLPELMEDGLFAAGLRFLVLDINTTQPLRGGAVVRSARPTRDHRQKVSLLFFRGYLWTPPEQVAERQARFLFFYYLSAPPPCGGTIYFLEWRRDTEQ